MMVGHNADPLAKCLGWKLLDDVITDVDRRHLRLTKTQKNIDQRRFTTAARSLNDGYRLGRYVNVRILIKGCVPRIGKGQSRDIDGYRFS